MLMPVTSCSVRRRRSSGGWTLVEVVVATGIGLIILAAFVAITLSINASTMAVGNYSDLDKSSRQTLDMLGREVRNASDVGTQSTTDLLVLTNSFTTTNVITYAWDGTNVTRLVSTPDGNPVEPMRVMLTSCDYLSFAYFIRVPSGNLEFISYTNGLPSNPIKLVSVSWRCSRSVLGSKLNTESVQTANIVLRN
jgi:type II secretory pathway component PulJ